jgi:hypothetical protein
MICLSSSGFIAPIGFLSSGRFPVGHDGHRKLHWPIPNTSILRRNFYSSARLDLIGWSSVAFSLLDRRYSSNAYGINARQVPKDPREAGQTVLSFLRIAAVVGKDCPVAALS